MISLTTSQAAAAAAPGAEPRILVQLGTADGVYYLAKEPTTWNGSQWAGRLLNTGEIQQVLSDGGIGLEATKSISVQVADADGWLGRRRPDFTRGYRMTVLEVFLDVPAAVRTLTFLQTGGARPNPTTFRVDAEDVMASLRRRPFPPNHLTMTTSLFPRLTTETALTNQTVPVLFGRCYCPLTLVDNALQPVFVACVGSATLSGDIIEYASNASAGSFVLSGTVAYSAVAGIPMTFVTFPPNAPIYQSGQLVPRFADLTSPLGASALPTSVLSAMLTNSFYGMGMAASDIDEGSLFGAGLVQFVANLFFDCAINTQRPLEDWLGDWSHDAATSIKFGTKLTVQNHIANVAAVASFAPNNIVRDSLTYRDLPWGTEQSRHVVEFTDRTAPHVTRFEVHDVGSGSEVRRVSPFIGRPSVAKRVAALWANRAKAGIRQYELTSTVKQIGLEEADPVFLTHSLAGATDQYAEVTGIRRQDGLYRFGLREISSAMYTAPTLPTDPSFIRRCQDVPPTSYFFFYPGTIELTRTYSHQLNTTPTKATVVYTSLFGNNGPNILPGSITTWNASEFTAYQFANVDNQQLSDWVLAYRLEVTP